MMFKRGMVLFAALVFGLGAIVAGCGDIVGEDELELGMVAWACAEAQTYVSKAVLEDELGYSVNVTTLEPAAVYSATAEGDLDLYIAAWLPVTHADYMDQYGDVLTEHNANFEGARIGLVVPEYVDINSIEELNDHAAEFGGQITGIDAGAGIMRASEDALDAYGMDDMELLESSDIAMTAALDDAIGANEWIVVTGWTPHWKFAEYDLKFLDDPQGIYGEEEYIAAVSRPGLTETRVDVAYFLDNFFMTDDQLGDVMGRIADDEEPIDAARAWVEENPDVVSEWIDQ